jgi:hypothetical protein
MAATHLICMGIFYLMKVETISFKTEYAEEYGIEAAILIQGIQLGLALNRYKETHNHFGKVWMYNSVAEWQRTYPFMSESTIKRALQKLREDKVLEVMQLDKNPMNKTNWYTLTNRLGQFEPMEEVILNQSKQYKTNNVKQTIDIDTTYKKSKNKFTPPTLEEVTSYLKEKSVNIDAQKFISYYEATDWYRGKTKIKNWKACVTTWTKNEKQNTPLTQNFNILTLDD